MNGGLIVLNFSFDTTVSKYKVSVFTGDKRGAGTDANVFVQMFGAMGESQERKLDNSQNNFERGRFVLITFCASFYFVKFSSTEYLELLKVLQSEYFLCYQFL